jgi:single-strand DNA-binding protein
MSIISQVIGNIGRDAELKTSENGNDYLNFSVASSEHSKKEDGNGQTTWVKVTLFGSKAKNLAQYLKKGTQVFAIGPAKVATFVGKDQTVHAQLEITADRIELLGRPAGKHDDEAEAAASTSTPASKSQPAKR